MYRTICTSKAAISASNRRPSASLQALCSSGWFCAPPAIAFYNLLCSRQRRSALCLLECLQESSEIMTALLDLQIDFGHDSMQVFPETIQTGAEGRKRLSSNSFSRISNCRSTRHTCYRTPSMISAALTAISAFTSFSMQSSTRLCAVSRVRRVSSIVGPTPIWGWHE